VRHVTCDRRDSSLNALFKGRQEAVDDPKGILATEQMHGKVLVLKASSERQRVFLHSKRSGKIAMRVKFLGTDVATH